MGFLYPGYLLLPCSLFTSSLSPSLRSLPSFQRRWKRREAGSLYGFTYSFNFLLSIPRFLGLGGRSGRQAVSGMLVDLLCVSFLVGSLDRLCDAG